MTGGFREFEFDLPEALLASLVLAFDQMEGASLSQEHLKGVPDAQGVYQLLLGQEIVYIGKTDSEAGLAKRLIRHARTIRHRTGLKATDISFKAIRVFVFTAMDLESQLIRHYRGKSSISWNNSGFGSNDPGRNRDKTQAKPTSFDALYPIDLDQTISVKFPANVTIANALNTLRKELPYTLRYDSSPVHETDLDLPATNLREDTTTVKKVLESVVASLPKGWQATALAGRVILYKEHDDGYPAGRVIARS